MLPKDYQQLDKEILEGRKPLPDDISNAIDRYQGTIRYINPYIKDPKDSSKNLFSPHVETMGSYSQVKPIEQESKDWGDALTQIFNVDPSTLEMTPKINAQRSQKYFNILKNKIKESSIPVDKPSSIGQEKAGIEVVGEDPRYSEIGLRFNSSTGNMEKVYRQSKENQSMAEIDDMEEAVTQLRDAYRKAGKEIPLEKQKQITQKIIEKYKAHSKRFGGNI